MNVYEKLNEARLRFQSASVKKSGKNNYAGYTYYELADILPIIIQLEKELKFTTKFTISTEIASLAFIDIEKPEDQIYFESPMAQASLKGCHDVQNLGAVHTYLKRYLYLNCFEIVESDCLDMTTGKEEEIDKMVKEVRTAIENNAFEKFTDKDKKIKYAEYCIHNRDFDGLKLITSSLSA